MHERSLARAVLRQVERIRRDRGGVVRRVRLSVGVLSGVEPLLLDAAFHDLAARMLDPDVALEINDAPLDFTCGSCGADSTRSDLCFACPTCGLGDVTITGGDAVILESVDLEIPQGAGEPMETDFHGASSCRSRP